MSFEDKDSQKKHIPSDRNLSVQELVSQITEQVTRFPNIPISTNSIDTLLAQSNALRASFQDPQTALEISANLTNIFSLQEDDTIDLNRLKRFWTEFLVTEIPTINKHMDSSATSDDATIRYWTRIFQDAYKYTTKGDTQREIRYKININSFLTDNILRMTRSNMQNTLDNFQSIQFDTDFLFQEGAGEYFYERAVSLTDSSTKNEQKDGETLAILALNYFNRPHLLPTDENLHARFYKIVARTLLSYGLDIEELMPTWYDSVREEQYLPIDIFTNNLLLIQELETRRHGICKVLREDFGIRHFSRYPIETLIRQYDERNEIELPYGLAISAVSDHSNSIRNYGAQKVEHALLGNYSPHPVRYIEVGSKTELAKRLLKLSHHYIPKIQFIILEGHGDNENIDLHYKSGTNYILTVEDLLSVAAHRLATLIDKNATIILASCSTGKKHPRIANVEQAMSILGFEVIAPDDDSYIRDISVTFYNGKLHFTVHYEGEDRNQVNAVRYKNGRELLSEEATRRLLH